MSKTSTHLQKTAVQRSNYRILGLVGQGHFGRVFCAIHRPTGALVALKELDKQRFPTNKFLRELRLLLSLQHSNIVTCQALEHTQTGRYLVMDYCEGGTLRNLIESKGQLSLAESLKLIADVLAGLEHAHSRDIVHCDIKPENVLLSLESTGWTARLSDFGVARIGYEHGDSNLGDTGSPAYMAPERFYGKFSPSSDLYAVGIMLFEMLIGYRPFSGLPGEIMTAHLNKPVKIPETVPFLLRSTILTALQKLPARRFTCAADMLRSIRLAAEVENLAQDETIFLSKPASGDCAERSLRVRSGFLQSELSQTAVESVSPLISTQQELRKAPVTSLVVASGQVYQAIESQVACQTHTNDALTGDPLHSWLLQLTAPVQALIVRPQACFALTMKRLYKALVYSVYCLPRTHTLPNFSGSQSEFSLERYQLLSLECIYLAIAIDPQGRWMAMSKVALSPDLSASQTSFEILHLPNLEPIQPPQIRCFPSQLIALDRRHVVAISTQIGDERARGVGTVFEVFTRRGNFIGALNLSVSLRLVTLSAKVPYRLLAIKQNNPTLALLIDLKPFRVFEIRLGIAPAFIVATDWGYILASNKGEIVLLNHQGQQIAGFSVPAAPSAIATFADYGLLVATWSGDRSNLYRVDLRQFEEGLGARG